MSAAGATRDRRRGPREINRDTHERVKAENEPRPVITARFRPAVSEIEPLREYVTRHAKSRFGNEAAERIALVVQELLENAVKYGEVTADVELEVRTDDTGRSFEIRVSNNSVPSRSQILQREVAKMAGLKPFDALEGAMRKVGASGAVYSMLGLARLRFEAMVELMVAVDGRRVTVVATGATEE